jgi:eukaryotic-like serine/threonine-protein kinase
VSTGPGEATVPAVAGLTAEKAEAQLRDAGFETRVERRFSDQVERGRVIGTAPASGSVVERGSTVVLHVSRGVEQVEVPDLVGDSEDEARSALEDAGLRAGEVTDRENADEELGTVLEQDPAAGGQVDRGSAVNLVVASAPPDAEVPDVIELQEDEARSQIENAGFAVSVRDRPVTNPDEDGVVLDQAPDPGSERPEGSTIRITIGRFESATPEPTGTAEPIP